MIRESIVEMIGRIRPNALFLSTICAVMVLLFGYELYGVIKTAMANPVGITESTVALILALAALVFTPLGALIALAVQMATDPPPPSVPAFLHDKLIQRFSTEPRINS